MAFFSFFLSVEHQDIVAIHTHPKGSSAQCIKPVSQDHHSSISSLMFHKNKKTVEQILKVASYYILTR